MVQVDLKTQDVSTIYQLLRIIIQTKQIALEVEDRNTAVACHNEKTSGLPLAAASHCCCCYGGGAVHGGRQCLELSVMIVLPRRTAPPGDVFNADQDVHTDGATQLLLIVDANQILLNVRSSNSISSTPPPPVRIVLLDLQLDKVWQTWYTPGITTATLLRLLASG